MKPKHYASALALAITVAGHAQAQDEPALDTSDGAIDSPPTVQAPAETAPAASAPSADPALESPAGGRTSDGGGTSIIGDSESPIGLYIIPWRASSPTPQLDRPARFVEATAQPVDETEFRRYVEYYNALTRHRAAEQQSGSGRD